MPDSKNLRYDNDKKQIVGKDAHLEDDNREAILKEIGNRYPPYSVRELRKAIREKRTQVDMLERQRRKINGEITEYQRLAKLCEQRDKEAAPYLDG